MIRIRQVKIRVEEDTLEKLQEKLEKILQQKITKWEIFKKSIDARDKKQIFYVYDVLVEIAKEEDFLKHNKNDNISLAPNLEYKLPNPGNEDLNEPIIIVGSGPAGLLAGYMLVSEGYKVIIMERGEKIEDRVKTVEDFWQTGRIDKESNVQFGEGGAGTFSDGKLNTLNKDINNRGRKVKEIMVKAGAPQEIIYLQYPHIGTDILRDVVKNMRKFIIDNGGEFRYRTKLTDLIIENGQLEKIVVNDKEEISCHNLILGIGHSARDTFKMLYDKGLEMEAKPFAMGVRVMHEQKMINEAQYGIKASYLPNANYKLTYTTSKNRGVYTFCMCPGGYVVNASSEEGKLTINGMSNYKRDSGISNSAIIVTVTPEDFGSSPLDGVAFQRKLEEKAYQEGKANIPIQTWRDFKLNKKSLELGEIKPQLKGKSSLANIRNVLPDYMVEALLEAMPYFGLKIKGFDRDDTILAAIEARSSSPVRIVRNEDMESNIKGIYPIGEGAGYAGGIMTSAIDGIKVAEKLIRKYRKNI